MSIATDALRYCRDKTVTTSSPSKALMVQASKLISFARGKIRDDRYYQTIEELGSFLYRCAERLQSANEREHNPVDGPEVDPGPKRTAPKRTRPTASWQCAQNLFGETGFRY